MEVEKLIGETTSLTLTGFKEGRRDTGDSRADEKPGRYSAKYGTSKIFQQKQESRRQGSLRRQKKEREGKHRENRMKALQFLSTATCETEEDSGCGRSEEIAPVAGEVLSLLSPSLATKRNVFSSSMDTENMQDERCSPMDYQKANSMSPRKGKSHRKRLLEKQQKIEEEYASLFMHPDYMVDIPADLRQEETRKHWYIRPRPEGTRCLVFTRKGKTFARNKHGKSMHRVLKRKTFASRLPGGNRMNTSAGSTPLSSNDASSAFNTIIDCIYSEKLDTFFVLDVLMWKHQFFEDLSAEFRLFWLQSRLTEIRNLGQVDALNQSKFEMIPFYVCTEEKLRFVYSNLFPFQKDGILFCNKESFYLRGLTSLVLLWKDRCCSQFYVDTPTRPMAAANTSEVAKYATQSCVLQLYHMDIEGSPVDSKGNPVLAYCYQFLGGDLAAVFTQEEMKEKGWPMERNGDLFRFTLSDVKLREASENGSSVESNTAAAAHPSVVTLLDLQYQSKSRNRVVADSACKVLFQAFARKDRTLEFPSLALVLKN